MGKKGQSPLMPGSPARILRDRTIAKLRSAGYTCRDIARETGLTPTHASLILRQPDIAAIVDAAKARYAEEIPDITEEFLRLCLRSKDEGVRTKNIENYHKILGIQPTAASIALAIKQDNRKTFQFNVYSSPRPEIANDPDVQDGELVPPPALPESENTEE